MIDPCKGSETRQRREAHHLRRLPDAFLAAGEAEGVLRQRSRVGISLRMVFAMVFAPEYSLGRRVGPVEVEVDAVSTIRFGVRWETRYFINPVVETVLHDQPPGQLHMKSTKIEKQLRVQATGGCGARQH